MGVGVNVGAVVSGRGIMVNWCFRKNGYSEVAGGDYVHSGEWRDTKLMAGQWLDSKSGARRSFGRGPRGLARDLPQSRVLCG